MSSNGTHNGSAQARLADRVPPQNLEAERSVLGAILLKPEVLADIAGILAADDFYRDSHQLVFEAIKQVAHAAPADLIAVGDYLRRKDSLKRIGGDEFLFDLVKSIPHTANARYHAEIVRAKAVCRRLITAAEEILHAAYLGADTAQEQLAAAQAAIFALGREGSTAATVHISEPLERAYARVLATKRGETEGITTGYADLDDLLVSLRPGNLAVAAGRPSMGKTAFALGIAEHNAITCRVPTLLFSLEMGAEEIASRLLQMHSRVSGGRFRDRRAFEPLEAKRITESVTAFYDCRLFVNDSSTLNVESLATSARQLCAAEPIGLVVVDYLQLITGSDSLKRHEQLGEITRRIKGLARELGLPVLLLSQLNRECERRADHRPVSSDLRDSGRIEEDADMVMLLHRPDYYDPNDSSGQAEVLLTKNRNGAVGRVRLTFLRDYARFANITTRADEAYYEF